MNTYKTFNPPQADKLPILSCIGKIGNVGETKFKEDTKNFVTQIDIQGSGAGKDQKVWITLNPKWIRFGYRPSDSVAKVYKRVVHSGSDSDDNLAALQAFGGSEEGYAELCTALDDLVEYDENNPDEFGQALNAVFVEFAKNGYEFGYVLRQQSTKNDETGEWERSRWYSVQRYFWPTEKQLDRERKSAEKQAEKIEKYYADLKAGTLEPNEDGEMPDVPTAFKVTFDEGIPF